MDKVVKTKSNEMRDLLRRWVELAPDEFSEDDLKTISDPDNLERNDVQAKIQYAVQTLIISRGWGLEVKWNTDRAIESEVMIRYGVKWTSAAITNNNLTMALLSTYLFALEYK